MTKQAKETLINRFIGVGTSLIVFLIAFYLGSFATDSDVKALEEKVKTKASKERVTSLETKVDKVLLGLCLIDKKTCVLRKEK